ncbi:hypothetical protein LFM09_04180 [Lentzea alba]|uniref:hypothetical protein n=1 Tax=Lentzea alba TaxID=2714351 RepID=UPI0039BF3DC9
MHTRWRWVLFGLGAAVAVSGPIAMAGGPWYGYVFGGLWSLMGGTVAWRSFGMGTKVGAEGITSSSLDRRTSIDWCDVQAIEPARRRNLIFFHTIAPVVRLRPGGEEKLTELSLLSVRKDSVPERAERYVTDLRQALNAHRARCSICGARPKELEVRPTLWSRLRRRFSSALLR